MSKLNGQSVQSDIMESVVAALGGNAAGTWRCRFSDFATSELPADNVIPEDEDPENLTTDDVEQTFKFHIRHMAAAVDGADKVADARYVRGAKLLLADVTLGGAVRRVWLTGRKWEMEKAERPIVVIVATYECEYSTALRDPSTPGY
jgi:hypothetical protein